MYNVDKGKFLTKEQTIQARKDAVRQEVITKEGRVGSYYALAAFFNKQFDTDYIYTFSKEFIYAKSVPNDLVPVYYKNGVDIPEVRFDHLGWAHTCPSLGGQRVYDVYHDKIEVIGGLITIKSIGYTDTYKDGNYRYGTHSYRK